MQRLIITSLLILFAEIIFSQITIEEIREEFYQITTEKKLDIFINKAKRCPYPEAKAYLASSLMWKADYAFLPTKKISLFKKGKHLLENLITTYPKMIEARFIRALLKSQAPKFLGYSKGYKSDLNFIKTNLNNSDIPTLYKSKIKNVLKQYNLL